MFPEMTETHVLSYTSMYALKDMQVFKVINECIVMSKNLNALNLYMKHAFKIYFAFWSSECISI